MSNYDTTESVYNTELRFQDKEAKQHTVDIRVGVDEDAEPPEDEGLEVYIARNRLELEAEISVIEPNETCAQGMLRKLLQGMGHRDPRGNWYRPLAKYEHGGVCYAFTGSVEHQRWPDQRWDVVPLVGWVKVEKEYLRELLNYDGWAAVKRTTRGFLEEYQAYANGEAYYWQISVDGEMLDMCGGYSDAYEAALHASTIASEYITNVGGQFM